jgi:hypothetical protein
LEEKKKDEQLKGKIVIVQVVGQVVGQFKEWRIKIVFSQGQQQQPKWKIVVFFIVEKIVEQPFLWLEIVVVVVVFIVVIVHSSFIVGGKAATYCVSVVAQPHKGSENNGCL